MQTSNDILDAVAKKLGGATDYRIGKETGIRQGTISNIRTGKCSLSAEGCAACAEILGVEVGALIAIATAERQENPDIRKSLLKLARRGMQAAAMTAAVGLSAAPSPPAQASSAQQQTGHLFIMSSHGGGRRRATRREKIPSGSIGSGEPVTPPVTRKPLLTLRTSPTLSPA